jgi:hypothetical protein
MKMLCNKMSTIYYVIISSFCFQVSASEERKIIGSLMLKVCSKLSFEDGSSEFEFLPTDWIKAYFANPQSGISLFTRIPFKEVVYSFSRLPYNSNR